MNNEQAALDWHTRELARFGGDLDAMLDWHKQHNPNYCEGENETPTQEIREKIGKGEIINPNLVSCQ